MIRHTALALALCVFGHAQAQGLSRENAAQAQQGERAARSFAATTATEPDAIRFLEQATFGPRRAQGVSPLPIDSVERVMSVGVSQAITEQLAAPRSVFDGTTATVDLGSQFFYNAVMGEDQLRQRVTFALSQILVVSESVIRDNTTTPELEPKLALADYLNLLSANAFGNYRTLLDAVSRNPAMGTYLNMANNLAFDWAGRPMPLNENYARELLQLFTLGLDKLNEDGTPVLDANGVPIPAYTETQVQAFARTFSGWTYASAAGCPTKGHNNTISYAQPLMACDVNHDSSAQTLLRGAVTTAGASATVHLQQALDNIFADPNLPPFISKQLIQHLVTSNPSPAYVSRVVAVFKDNGGGVRGDLGAVVRAILEDPEARGDQAPAEFKATYGRLRSPALFITSLVRGLNGTLDATGSKNPGGRLNTYSRTLGQDVPRPPSVFSYYSPKTPLPGGNGLVGPEFGVLDTATAAARANFVYDLVYSNLSSAGIVIDFTTLPVNPNDLVAWLGRYWIHGEMSSELSAALLKAMNDPRAGSSTRKQQLAIYLTSLSPEFQIQR
ncbi:hypothetical protein D187_005706 [Cystobacter fuscus DSM 2262]|uniref:DUF1800 domain-containing protein n=1 Tax=Cystobacter fuscus (strain ATCC 25194 / DSM 2262 / NBRC 100088 / M29) TaxID=1242864 RepID=S9PFY8_CYSF2|nr:DUF1800 family protein [Cystobacter fuscus]EPX63300.1 hypothetical protein D187_005706 [Cystobacter fuscus DSM 2262]